MVNGAPQRHAANSVLYVGTGRSDCQPKVYTGANLSITGQFEQLDAVFDVALVPDLCRVALIRNP